MQEKGICRPAKEGKGSKKEPQIQTPAARISSKRKGAVRSDARTNKILIRTRNGVKTHGGKIWRWPRAGAK